MSAPVQLAPGRAQAISRRVRSGPTLGSAPSRSLAMSRAEMRRTLEECGLPADEAMDLISAACEHAEVGGSGEDADLAQLMADARLDDGNPSPGLFMTEGATGEDTSIGMSAHAPSKFACNNSCLHSNTDARDRRGIRGRSGGLCGNVSNVTTDHSAQADFVSNVATDHSAQADFERELLELSSFRETEGVHSAPSCRDSRPASSSCFATQIMSRPVSGCRGADTSETHPRSAGRRAALALQYAAALEEQQNARRREQREQPRLEQPTSETSGREARPPFALQATADGSAAIAARAHGCIDETRRLRDGIQAMKSQLEDSEKAATNFFKEMTHRIDTMGAYEDASLARDGLTSIDPRLLALLSA